MRTLILTAILALVGQVCNLPAQQSVWLYPEPNFAGLPKEYKADTPSLPANARYRSLRVGAKVYADLFDGKRYSGRHLTTYSTISELPISPRSLKLRRKAEIDVQPVYRPGAQETIGYSARVSLGGLQVDLADEHRPCDQPCYDATCPPDGGFFYDSVFPVYDPAALEKSWYGRHPMQLMINTSYFKICRTAKYHEVKCANGSGLLIAGGRKVLDTSVRDELGRLLDAIVFWKDGRVDLFLNNDVPKDLSKAEVAMAGHWFFTGDQLLCGDCRDPDTRRARTAMGLDDRGRNLIIVVVQAGQPTDGMSARELHDLMKGRGAVRGFMLDGGGSSQFLFAGERLLTVVPGDREGYRPVPSAFGIVGLKK